MTPAEYMARRAERIARGGMTNERFLACLREYEAEARARRIERWVDVALLVGSAVVATVVLVSC